MLGFNRKKKIKQVSEAIRKNMGKQERSRSVGMRSPKTDDFPNQQRVDVQIEKHRRGLKRDVVSLLLKIAAVLAAFTVVFMFVFGIYRSTDVYMSPAVKDGDVVMYYRLDKSYVADDIAVVMYDGKPTAGRVIAVGGDTVDIDDKGLKVNGAYHAEPDIFYDTTQVADGVTFPLEVPRGCVFVLGDNRTHAIDSRIFGCVEGKDTLGKVIVVLRRRGF